jgi:hypothetical protein
VANWLGALLLVSCQAVSPPRPAMTEDEMARAAPGDARTLDRIAKDNAALREAFLALRDSGGWQERGYFSAEESDRVELLLFRYYAGHQRLGEISASYAGAASGKGRALRMRADRLAKQQAEFLVETFKGDPVAIKKLNQRYPRSEIPRDTYEKVADSLRWKIVRDAGELGRDLGGELDESSYEVQAELFFTVSRLKPPTAYVVRFSEAQKREVRARMRPGDLVLTYTGGYASNIFIPGSFKHGMTYVGTPEERRAAGLSADRIMAESPMPSERTLAAHLKQATTNAGRPANLIEAVGEGVKFSNLEHIMDTHIWRMLVVRPRLDARARARQIGRTFSYLGQEYDFRFDFSDSSRQVCTEVIYRSLNGMGGIDFPLMRRGGNVTLSADDLIGYWLEERPEAFEFVLYAEEAPRSRGHPARLFYGKEGKGRLKELMGKAR